MTPVTTNSPSTRSIDPSTIVIFPPRSSEPISSARLPEATGQEGGKGGSAPVKAPPSPPFAASPAAFGTADADFLDDGIFMPAPTVNPLVARALELGLYVKEVGEGRHLLRCPWQNEREQHDDPALFTEPSGGATIGQYHCKPCLLRGRHVGDLLALLQVNPVAARSKARIRVKKGDMHLVVDAAERVLSLTENVFTLNGTLVRLTHDLSSRDLVTEHLTEHTLALILSEEADWEQYDGRSKGWAQCDVPLRIVLALLKKQSYNTILPLKGLARQPFLRRSDRTFVIKSGYDPESQIYAAFSDQAFSIDDPTRDSAMRALGRLKHLLSEFHFSSDRDRSAALCGILTATLRPSLALAPAFNISASRPGSGKSYLADMFVAFSGPGEAHNLTYPRTGEEASKVVLSALSQSPAALCFDDMTTDWLAHSAMNRMLTSKVISERVLGSSQMRSASTNTFVMGTGNNIRPLKDMCRRTVSIYLNQKTKSVTSTSYSRDPVKSVRANREAYVSLPLTIVAAYLNAGSPKTPVPTVPSYDDWNDLCRQSLLWLEEPDPAASLIEQVEEDPDMDMLADLLSAWHGRLGSHPTSIRRLLDEAESAVGLRDALFELPCVEGQYINRSKLGHYLKRNANRTAGDFELQQSRTSERNAWKVVQIGHERSSNSADSPVAPDVQGCAYHPPITPLTSENNTLQ